MLKRRNGNKKGCKGFTLMELLIVVAIIAILAAISIPVFSKLIEKSREATDIANVRSAYAEVMLAAISRDTDSRLYDSSLDAYTKTVSLKQKQDGWVTNTDTLSIAGITRSSANWKGDAKANGTCKVVYSMVTESASLIWSGYTVYIGYQWIEDGNNVITAREYNYSGWPASAVPEFISAKNGTGQTVEVDQISDKYPALKACMDSGGYYEIGIFTTDKNGKILADTGGQPIFDDEVQTFEISTENAEVGADVNVAIQFFKFTDRNNRNRTCTEITEAEARELENIFTITGE